jgi:diamine N-acetyltransferase
MLRATTPDDLAEVHAMEQAADTGQWLGETGRRWHEQALADPDQAHLAVGPSGALTAFAVLAGLERGDRVIELRRMVVAPASRGTGQGRALLRAALAYAYDQHGARRVWLDVRPGNQRARSLYEAEGFAPVADAGPAPGDDLLVMEHRREP